MVKNNVKLEATGAVTSKISKFSGPFLFGVYTISTHSCDPSCKGPI